MLEYADIRRLLPHRHPILLVDRVVDIKPWKELTALKVVSGAEPCYGLVPEHAPPEAYAYPVSLLTESFGQSALVLWMYSAELDGTSVTGTLLFCSARDCVIHQPVLPGQTMRHRVRLDRVIHGNKILLNGETWVDDDLIVEYSSLLAITRPETEVAVTGRTTTG